MKKIIRKGTFETNSSSTHSLILMLKNDYDEWIKGNLYSTDRCYPRWFDGIEMKRFVTHEEALELMKHYRYLPDEQCWDDEIWVNDQLVEAGFRRGDYENEYADVIYQEFTTPSGEVVVAVSEYEEDY